MKPETAASNDLQTFLEARIRPVLKPLLVDLLRDKPENVLRYVADWCVAKETSGPGDEESETSGVLTNLLSSPGEIRNSPVSPDLQMPPVAGRFSTCRYLGYSSFRTPRIPASILIAVKKCPLFKDFDSNMFLKICAKMQVIVLQPGEALESAKTHSSDLFFVHLGTLERRRLPTDPTSQPGDSPTIARYASGDFFGQLLSIDRRYCLSYTIVAENSVVLYKLDAKTFVKAASAATKQRRTACLPLFQVSGPLHGQFTSEPDRLIDCLEVESFQAGRPVPIADHPNHIWFVLTGRAEVVSVQSPPSDGLTDFPQCFQQMQYFCHKTITSHLRRDTEIQAGSGNLLTARIDLADFQRLGGRTDHLTLAINSPPVRRRPTTVSDLNLN